MFRKVTRNGLLQLCNTSNNLRLTNSKKRSGSQE